MLSPLLQSTKTLTRSIGVVILILAIRPDSENDLFLKNMVRVRKALRIATAGSIYIIFTRTATTSI